MSISTNKTFNGVSYTIPAQGESNWGTNVSLYLIAIADGALQKTGGTFTLTADVDFGGSYGLKAMKFSSRSTPSTTGIVRLGNNESVAWRNAANSADLAFKVNDSNVLEFNGNPMLTLALGTANYILKMNSGGTAYEWGELANANIAAAAGIVDTKLATIATAGKVSNSATTAASVNTASAIVARDGSGNFAAGTATLTAVVVGDILLQNSSGAQPELRLSEDPDNGTSKVIIKAPAALSGDVTLTLPDSDGGSNQVLTTDGSGALSWSTVATTVTTTRGDVIKRGAAADERLAIGAADKVLVSDGTDPSWGLTVKSGTYTPSALSYTNCSASSVGAHQYIQVGNMVMVAGSTTVTVTTTGADTYVEVDLPVARANFADSTSANGSGTLFNAANNNRDAAIVSSVSGAQRARFRVDATSVGSATAAAAVYSFMYTLT